MKRRSFLKAAALSGLAVMSPLGGSMRLARAADDGYDGPFFIVVHAGGGWDPTSLCDPKGRANELTENPVNMYFTGEIGSVGAINYAPVEGHKAFFDKYYNDLLVINGIDMETNGHDSGTRHMWSGNLAEGHPSFAALVAGALAPTRPMAFISNGGLDFTAGVVPLTRIGNTNVFNRLAYPDRIDPNDGEYLYHSASTEDRLRQYRSDRLQALMANQGLPRVQRAQNVLFTARSAKNELKQLSAYLPEELDNSGNGLKRQAQLAIAAYKAGLAVSVNMSQGGFDTHGNHDANHYPRLGTLLEGVDFLVEEAKRQGVWNKCVVVMGSDFGRTPYYNDGNGKDHWSVTSMMFMGAGIKGNRVIGGTTADFRPLSVNASSLKVDEGGIRIKPKHIHKALRKLAGIEGGDVARYFPVDAEDLALFG